MSILTITSNVMYGKKTASTPDRAQSRRAVRAGRESDARPRRDGAVASLKSVAKLPYDYAEDGISYTFSIVPDSLGRTPEEKRSNLISLLDGYFSEHGHHLNVNVLQREMLLDAMEHPKSIRSLRSGFPGYAVNFIRLTRRAAARRGQPDVPQPVLSDGGGLRQDSLGGEFRDAGRSRRPLRRFPAGVSAALPLLPQPGYLGRPAAERRQRCRS